MKDLGFDLNVPTTYRFYEIFSEQCGLGVMDNERRQDDGQFIYENVSDPLQKKRREQLLFGRFLIEYVLMDFNCYNIRNSLIAASVVFLINKVYKRETSWYFN